MFDMMPFERRNSMARFDPFRELENFEKSFFGDFGGGFRTDIKDKGDHFELEADLPGVKKEDIAVDIDGDCLTISAQRDSQREEKNDQEQYVRRERSYGSYSRSFDISNVKSEEISGSYENGVLKLLLPKRSPTGSASRRLDIQ
ncbi:MAG TPA: Hsp20/alpha crystallin family protein [Candidatus Acutalibacter pullistercoris]|uniref:Hsp20/alpha crystallin family protein n=1 Tax=Candidatus Acutalibacter pullistercoris TaxID=2838418 RepID=A0A9D1YDA4_9FIRM|nr:Hsp20/alpha crystallin family protein [Candidatus Acutalibacter pullistercoris]